jgi:hypothetical protein
MSRFALLGVLAYAAFVTCVPQGRETALLYADNRGWYIAFTVFFALEAWAWARLMVSYRYLPAERRQIDLRTAWDRLETFRGKGSKTSEHLRALRDKYAVVHVQEQRRRSPPRGGDGAGRTRHEYWMAWLPRGLGVLVFFFSALSLYLGHVTFQSETASENGEVSLLMGAATMLLLGVLSGFFFYYRRTIAIVIEIGVCNPHGDLNGDGNGRGHVRALGDYKDDPKHVHRYSAGVLLNRFTGEGRLPRRLRRGLLFLLKADSRDDIQDQWCWYRFPDLLPSTQAWLIIWSIVPSVAWLWAALDPVEFGRLVGPLPALVLLLAFWMMLGTWAVFALDHRRFPLISALVALGLALSLFMDNHAVRTSSSDAVRVLPRERPTLERVVKSWRDSSDEVPREETGTDMTRNHTPVIVATAGGGIRAAYWTALALTELARRSPRFRANLVAVSAVSGGGLGAAAFLAAEACAGQEGEVVRTFLSQDFLSPVVSAMLTRDAQFAILPVVRMPDRAAVLEQAWEFHWRQACKDPDGKSLDTFARPFLALSQRPANATDPRTWRPALVINGTLVNAGRRVLTSPFLVTPSDFHDAHDVYDYLGGAEMPLSTAVHNGARFTFVSPAGTLFRKDLDGRRANTGQIIDGGYFENYGAETAGEILRRVCAGSGCAAGARPVVIQISSDPELPATADSRDWQNPLTEPGTLGHHSQIYSPVQGLQATRAARGVNAMKRLKVLTEDYGGVFASLRLCALAEPSGAGVRPPLGWVLSKAARETIEGHLTQGCSGPFWHDNDAEFNNACRALNPDPAACAGQ